MFHTYKHTYIHAYIHTYIHTHTYMKQAKQNSRIGTLDLSRVFLAGGHSRFLLPALHTQHPFLRARGTVKGSVANTRMVKRVTELTVSPAKSSSCAQFTLLRYVKWSKVLIYMKRYTLLTTVVHQKPASTRTCTYLSSAAFSTTEHYWGSMGTESLKSRAP